MLSKKHKIHFIIGFIIITTVNVYGTESYSAQYRRNNYRPYRPVYVPRKTTKIISPVKKLTPLASPTPDPIAEQQKAIEEKVNNLDSSVSENKKEILSSTEKINDIKAKQNDLLSENQDLKLKNQNLYNFVLGLISALILLCLIFLAIVFKVRNNTNKTVSDLRKQQIEKTDEIISERVKDFDHALKDNLSNLSKKSNDNTKVSLSDFEKSLSETINKHIKDYSAKIDAENNNPEALEVKRYLNSITFKEKEISSKIERIHMANTYFNTANTLMKSEFYSDAAEEYEEAIKAHPVFYGAYLNLGKAYEKMGEKEKAVETYLKAIEINPKYYKAYFNLACIYFEQKDYDKAIENYEQVLNLKNDNYKTYNNLAIIYNFKADKEKAADYYKKALENNKDYVEAYFNLVILEASIKKEDNIYHIAALYTKKYNASSQTSEKLDALIEEHLKKKEALTKS